MRLFKCKSKEKWGLDSDLPTFWDITAGVHYGKLYISLGQSGLDKVGDEDDNTRGLRSIDLMFQPDPREWKVGHDETWYDGPIHTWQFGPFMLNKLWW